MIAHVFLAEFSLLSFHCPDGPQSIHPGGRLGGFRDLSVMTSAAVSIHVQVSVWTYVFNSVG